jgi:hypothetical protein
MLLRISAPVILALVSTHCLVQWVPGRFPGGWAAGAWRWPCTPPPPSAEVKERIELYFCCPCGALTTCSEGEFHLSTFPINTNNYCIQTCSYMFRYIIGRLQTFKLRRTVLITNFSRKGNFNFLYFNVLRITD